MRFLNGKITVSFAAAFLALSFFPTLVFAQKDTGIIQQNAYDTLEISEDSGFFSNASDTFRFVADSIQTEKRVVELKRLQSYYQAWNDQFPSPIIQHSFGSAIIEESYDILRKKTSEDWKFYLSFSLLILLALIRFGYSREFEEISSVFRNWGPSQQMFRELGTGVSFGTVLLNFFSLLVIALFVFLLISWYGIFNIDPPWIMMLIAVGVVALFLLARYILLKAASLLLPFRKEITLYNFYEIQMNRMLGVALFPLVLLVTFSSPPVNEYALYASLAVVGGCILMRYLKGFNIGINYFGRHLFHFLLYICALEIAPVLIIIRLLQNLGPLRFSF
ncbi:MAG: DUF4271 domain-containing protein [Chitinophagales bacterium]